MSDEIIIKGIPQSYDRKDKRWDKLKEKFPQLPKPPFRMIVLGQSGSGKSSFVYSLLKRYYKRFFDQIIIFSGTIDSNDAWGSLKDHAGDPPQIFNEYNGEALEMYLDEIEMEHQKAMDDDEDPDRILLIFDDLVTDGISNRHKMNIMDKLFVQLSRHYNISVIILTQYYNALNRNQRAINLSHLVIYPISKNDMEIVAMDHTPAGMDSKEFQLIINKILTRKPYSFAVLDYTKPPEKRIKMGLGKPVKVQLEEQGVNIVLPN